MPLRAVHGAGDVGCHRDHRRGSHAVVHRARLGLSLAEQLRLALIDGTRSRAQRLRPNHAVVLERRLRLPHLIWQVDDFGVYRGDVTFPPRVSQVLVRTPRRRLTLGCTRSELVKPRHLLSLLRRGRSLREGRPLQLGAVPRVLTFLPFDRAPAGLLDHAGPAVFGAATGEAEPSIILGQKGAVSLQRVDRAAALLEGSRRPKLGDGVDATGCRVDEPCRRFSEEEVAVQCGGRHLCRGLRGLRLGRCPERVPHASRVSRCILTSRNRSVTCSRLRTDDRLAAPRTRRLPCRRRSRRRRRRRSTAAARAVGGRRAMWCGVRERAVLRLQLCQLIRHRD
mmetsp:Transcript_52052/g.134993  ORF Transcript_52052/g.134993 Transcript_52052/m.134993 type:complete len:338 (-) Transcript_52052:56-1069(-)